MKRPAWVNVAGFALSRRQGYCPLLASVLLLVWWNLADFYVSQRFRGLPELNEILLMGCTFCLLLSGLVLATRRKIRRGLSGFAVRDLSVEWPEKLDERRAVLSEIATHCDGLSGKYVEWLRARRAGWKPWL